MTIVYNPEFAVKNSLGQASKIHLLYLHPCRKKEEVKDVVNDVL